MLVGAIARGIAGAVETGAERVAGPIRRTGHSTGVHWMTRLMVGDAPVRDVTERVERAVPISGLLDLGPLLVTVGKEVRLGMAWALAESPALPMPREGTRLPAGVGRAERSEFVRRSKLVAGVRCGLGAETGFVAEPDRHRFDVVDGRPRPDSPLRRGAA